MTSRLSSEQRGSSAKSSPGRPPYSYGLVIELSSALMPVGSAHSRADGRRHAISDALVWNGDLVAVSKASGELLNLGCSGDPA